MALSQTAPGAAFFKILAKDAHIKSASGRVGRASSSLVCQFACRVAFDIRLPSGMQVWV